MNGVRHALFPNEPDRTRNDNTPHSYVNRVPSDQIIFEASITINFCLRSVFNTRVQHNGNDLVWLLVEYRLESSAASGGTIWIKHFWAAPIRSRFSAAILKTFVWSKQGVTTPFFLPSEVFLQGYQSSSELVKVDETSCSTLKTTKWSTNNKHGYFSPLIPVPVWIM